MGVAPGTRGQPRAVTDSDDRWQPRCAAPEGLALPVPLDPLGKAGPTRGAAKGPRWRAASYGLYVPADADAGRVEQRIIEAAAILAHPRDTGGAVTGWAAARLHQGGFFDGLARDGATPMPVPLIRPGATRAKPGTTLVRSALEPSERTRRHGVPVATPERAVIDEIIRLREPREGVVVIDMACAGELTSMRRLTAAVERAEGRRWMGLVRRCLALAGETSRSPGETRLRLLWVLDAGAPEPLANRPIWSLDGTLLGVPDLVDVEAGVVGEYDGALHRERARHRRDNDRIEAFAAHRIERVAMVAGDSDAVVAERIVAARSRAAWLAPAERSWTLDPPPGAWIPPQIRGRGLDARLAERERRTARTG